MNNEDVTLVVCPSCGQINLLCTIWDGCTCPVCSDGNSVRDDLRIELVR
jgi:hypothetical protein